MPVAEFQLTTDTIRRFRTGYVAAFGAADPDDLLYEAVSEGRRHPGMEHWLPLFHDKLDTLFDYLPGAPVIARTIWPRTRRASGSAQIADYYEARKEALDGERSRHALQAAAAGPALSRRGRMGERARAPRRWRGSRRSRCRTRPARRSMSARAPAAISRAERAETDANVFDAVTQARRRRCRRPASASSSRCGARARASA